MKNKPNVSIVVPIYNVELYLEKCVDSLLAQTMSNIEIILVDDGSTDGSRRICEKYSKVDQRVQVINQQNGGLSSARNTGTIVAKGTYITYVDADDWLEHETCEKVYNIAEEGEYDLVFWQMIKEYENDSVFVLGPFGKDVEFDGAEMKKLQRRIAGPIGTEMKKPQLIDSFASAWGKFYKNEIIKSNNLKFVDTKIIGSEDIFFNFQYFGCIKKAYYLHRHFIHYRKDNLTSLTKTHGSTLFPRFLELFNYLGNEIEEKVLDNIFKEALKNRIGISMMNVGLSEVSPRNKKSALAQIKSLNAYLSEPVYVDSFVNFSFKHFPMHWKLFFYFCKIKFGFGVFLMLKGMRVIIK